MRIIFWALIGATIGIYGIMVLWSLPLITQEADGLLPFDLRPFGYSYDEATAFLNALSEEGRAFYLETQLLLDTAYPALLAASLLWLIRLVFRGQMTRLALSLIAIAASAADYLENHAIEGLLSERASAAEISTASLWTLAKSLGDTVVFTALVLGVVMLALRRWMPR